MEEKSLLRIALVIAIVGICALAFILRIVKVGDKTMLLTEEGDSVRLTGVVQGIRSFGNMSIISVRKQENVDVIVFGITNISKGEMIDVLGKVKEYKGKNELLADRIIRKD